jgi:hypothetical protein
VRLKNAINYVDSNGQVKIWEAGTPLTETDTRSNDASIYVLPDGTRVTLFDDEVGTVNLTWKDVFDSSKVYWGWISWCAEVAKKAGYKYFHWNDCVYQFDDSGNYIDTGLLISDVK